MNDGKGEKYGISPNDVEKTSYPVENLGHYLTLKGQNNQIKISDRLDKDDQRKYASKKEIKEIFKCW